MRRSLICFFALALQCAGVARSQTAAQSSATVAVIRAGTLIDGTSDKPRKNQLIFVRGGRIEKATDTSTAIPEGANVIDRSNSTVLAGMIDAHSHSVSVV